jgi:RNA 2',3'-cyclic 3'-phosphodiesterase
VRLFVGVQLCDALREDATAAAESLRARLGSRLVARWVAPEQLHITVRFIGHVDDSDAPAVIDAVSPPIPLNPFDLRFGGCGVFPRSGPPRVIWIALAEGLASCGAIHAELDRRLSRLGFEPETRPFSAHLTLARVKDVRGSTARDIRNIVTTPIESSGICQVTHATLFQSHLSPKGSRYETVARIDLAT